MLIRIATYNVHDFVGQDGRYAPERIFQVIKNIDADIIALQETTLDRNKVLLSSISKETDMEAVDGSLFDRGKGRYGNIVLSRLPVVDIIHHDVSVIGREPRGIVELTVNTDNKNLSFLATHLGLGYAERREQLQRLSEIIHGKPQINLVLGDFNVWTGTAPLRILRNIGFEQRTVASFPTWPFPLLALDHILFRAPLHLKRYWPHTLGESHVASDHFPIVAEIEI